ncbi:MAG: PhoH family protein [Polyangiales bacterium]
MANGKDDRSSSRSTRTTATAQLEIDDTAVLMALAGARNDNLRALEQEASITIGLRGNQIHLQGPADEVAFAERVLAELVGSLRDGNTLNPNDVARAARLLREHPGLKLRDVFDDVVLVSARHRVIAPKGLAQKKYIEAIRSHDVVFGIGPAGTGKCVAADTLVLTDRGMLPIESIVGECAEDDYVPIDCNVSGLYGVESASHGYNGGSSSVRRIRTRLGFEISATPEHPLLRLMPNGEMEWCRADELEPGDHVAIQRGQQLFGSTTAVEFSDSARSKHSHPKPVTIDHLDEEFAYMMGALTGDGCLTFTNRVIFTSADEPLMAKFEAFAARFGLETFANGRSRPYDRIIASAALYRLLEHLGMSTGRAETKRIPSAILQAPREIVVAFLRGLFDTDGTVDKRSGYPSLCSASKQLIREVQLVLLNLGMLSSQRERRVKISTGERKTYFELEVRGGDAREFFRSVGFELDRKQSLQPDDGRSRNTNVDVVPHLSRSIQGAIAAAVPLSRETHKVLGDYRIGRRQPSYDKLEEILGLLQLASHTADYQRMALIAQRHLFWAEITEITHGKARVFDLTVPSTHSFCANGFVNHNTYLAMAMAVAALMQRQVKRIILTRPAVEAGEKLGFLPGDLAEKVNPYLRPLYDALHDMMDIDKAQALIQRGQIEVAPLAFMRGRTLNDSFVIMDEAQNTTAEQMKMFLTRLGFESKAVITGDVTQVDLPRGQKSGLSDAVRLLADVDGIKIINFTAVDVVRHPLVGKIIRAYEARDSAIERAHALREERDERSIPRVAGGDGPDDSGNNGNNGNPSKS